MLIRVYCAKDHPRAEFYRVRANHTYVCPICGDFVTREATYQSLPSFYKDIVNTDFGGVLASLADIGAIDLIYHGKYPLSVEYAREKDL